MNQFAVGVVGAEVTNLRSTIDNDFWSIPNAFLHEPTTATEVYDLQGQGNPENGVVAGVGSTYRDVVNGLFYVKRTGTAAGGWATLQAL